MAQNQKGPSDDLLQLTVLRAGPLPLPSNNEDELRQKRLMLYYWYDKWITIIQKRKLPGKYLRMIGLSKLGRPRKQAQSASPRKQKKEKKPSGSPLPPTVASD